MKLKDEAHRVTRMLRGKVVRRIFRHRRKEVGLEFADGTRLFVDWATRAVEISVTKR